jgi:hypothetical protein
MGHELVHLAPRRKAGVIRALGSNFAICAANWAPVVVVGIDGLSWAIMVVNGP